MVGAFLLALAASLGIERATPPRAQPAASVVIHAPRGRTIRSPRAVHWSTTRPAAWVRLVVINASRERLVDRTAGGGAHGRIPLHPEERARIEAAGEVRIEILAASDDGELLGMSDPVAVRVGGR